MREINSQNFLSSYRKMILFICLLDLFFITNNHCIRELNPAETSRSYSSRWWNDQIGTGFARSMLDSQKSWSTALNKQGQWMIIDLGTTYNIAGLIIQSRKDLTHYYQTVTSFSFSYSSDAINYVNYPGIVEGANDLNDTNKKFYRYFTDKISARYVKFFLFKWIRHISMRAGVAIFTNEPMDSSCLVALGYFYDSTVNHLKQCDVTTCKTCSQANYKCIICNSGFYKLKDPVGDEVNRCYSLAQKPNYYLNADQLLIVCTISCVTCNISCVTCDISSLTCDISCVKCVTDNFYCSSCKTGYYKKFENPVIYLNYCYSHTSFPNNNIDTTANILKLCDQSCDGCL